MPAQSHLFVLDPLASLNFKLDSSLRLCKALSKRGHRVFATEQQHMAWRSDEKAARARVRELSFPSDDVSQVVVGEQRIALLTEFSGIHMRKDPPFDLEYVSTTWLLESARGKARIYNDPAALRGLNEKLSLLLYPNETRKALVSSDPQELLSFIQNEARGEAVLKPLALFGGRGVRRLNLEGGAATDRVLATIREETRDGQDSRIVQAFDPSIFEGEVRAFAVGGEPLAWCLKRPKGDNFLANTSAGATLESFEPTPELAARVERVAQDLLRRGVSFVGFDLIGGYISEINITSPRLLAAPGDDRDYYGPMADWVIADAELNAR